MALIAAVLLVFQFVSAGHSGARGADRYETLEPQVLVVAQFCTVARDVGRAPRSHDPIDCPDNCRLIEGASPIAAVLQELGVARQMASTDGDRRALGSDDRRPARIAGWATSWSASGPPV